MAAKKKHGSIQTNKYMCVFLCIWPLLCGLSYLIRIPPGFSLCLGSFTLSCMKFPHLESEDFIGFQGFRHRFPARCCSSGESH
jgi:hypothetical protein